MHEYNLVFDWTHSNSLNTRFCVFALRRATIVAIQMYWEFRKSSQASGAHQPIFDFSFFFFIPLALSLSISILAKRDKLWANA